MLRSFIETLKMIFTLVYTWMSRKRYTGSVLFIQSVSETLLLLSLKRHLFFRLYRKFIFYGTTFLVETKIYSIPIEKNNVNSLFDAYWKSVKNLSSLSYFSYLSYFCYLSSKRGLQKTNFFYLTSKSILLRHQFYDRPIFCTTITESVCKSWYILSTHPSFSKIKVSITILNV